MINIRSSVLNYARVRHLTLHRRDLLQLDNLLRSASEDVKITYKQWKGHEYTVNSLSEIPPETKLEEIQIRVEDVDLSLYLTRELGATFHFYNDKDSAYSLIIKILALLNSCKSRIRTILASLLLPGVAVIFIDLIAAIIFWEKDSPKWMTWLFIGGAAVGLLMYLLGTIMLLSRFSNHISMSEQGAVNFFSRNRDKIILGLAFAVAGALATKLLG